LRKRPQGSKQLATRSGYIDSEPFVKELNRKIDAGHRFAHRSRPFRVDHEQLLYHFLNGISGESSGFRQADDLAIHTCREVFAPERDVTDVVTLHEVDYDLPPMEYNAHRLSAPKIRNSAELRNCL